MSTTLVISHATPLVKVDCSNPHWKRHCVVALVIISWLDYRMHRKYQVLRILSFLLGRSITSCRLAWHWLVSKKIAFAASRWAILIYLNSNSWVLVIIFTNRCLSRDRLGHRCKGLLEDLQGHPCPTYVFYSMYLISCKLHCLNNDKPYVLLQS